MEQRVGLYYLRDRLGRKPRVSITDVRPIGKSIRIQDSKGGQLVLSKDEAIPIYYALRVALKVN